MPAQITLPFLESMAAAARDNVPIELEGDTTSADATLSNLDAMAGVAIGAAVSGAGIPAGTTIIQINDTAHTAEMSATATASAAGVALTFTNPGTVFDTPQAVLYTNNPAQTLDTVLGDLVQPTYTGYAAQAVTWEAIYQDPTTKDIVFESSLLVWQPTNITGLPQAIYGYGLTSLISGVQTLQRLETLPTPKAFVSTLDQLAFVIVIRMSATKIWGGVVQVN